MRKKARLMVTLKCERDCPYCVNKDTKLMSQAHRISGVSALKDYDEVIVTGGEPLLDVPATLKTLRALRDQNSVNIKRQTIYLYTSICPPHLEKVIPLVDGITYTIHQHYKPKDMTDLLAFQATVHGQDKSFRLSVSPDINAPLGVVPAIWKSIKIKYWYPIGECLLPEGEELFILEE